MRGFVIWSCVVQSKWETEIRIVKEARIQDVAQEIQGRLVGGPLRRQDQLNRPRRTLSESQRHY